MEIENKTSVSTIIDQTTKDSIKQYFNIDIDSDLLSPTTDYVFKRIFTADEERSKIALIDFLNSVLEFELSKQITDLTVTNPQIPVDAFNRKKSIFDVRVKFNDGEQAIIEMQLANNDNFKKRSQFIISKAYISQPLSGSGYNELKKCYLIGIVNFTLLGDKEEFINDYRYRDRLGNDLADDETIIFVELPKIDRIIDKPVNEMSNVEMWAIFFRYVTDKSKRSLLKSIIGRKGGIHMAFSVLDEISSSEEERIQYENELIFELDRISAISYAMSQGEIKGRLEGKLEGEIETKTNMAKNLKSIKIPIEQIAEVTGLSIKEIQKL